MSNIQRDIFPTKGATSTSKPQYALPVIDQTSSQFTTQTLTAGTDFTVPAGSEGQSCKIQFKFLPILGNYGRTGSFGNSSFAFGGALATTFTTEVAFVADSSNLGGDVTNLSNGQYMVDYEAGIVYGKRADSGTTGTATYNYLAKGSVGGTGSSANQVQGNVASDAADSGNPVKVGGVYNSTKPTVADGDRVDWQMTNRGEGQVVEQYAPASENNPESTSAVSERFLASNSYAKSTSQNNSFQTFNAKAGAGTLIYVNVINTAASVRYLQTHNTITTPSGGATAYNKWLIPANGSLTLGPKELAGNGIYHSTGVAFANSSTATTYTAGVAGDLLLEYVVV